MRLRQIAFIAHATDPIAHQLGQVFGLEVGFRDPGVEFFGVGLAGENLDVMSQFDQSAAQVADVHALAAAVRLAAIRQQRNPHSHAQSEANVEVEITSKGSGGASADFLDTCLDYSLTSYLTQRTGQWHRLCRSYPRGQAR